MSMRNILAVVTLLALPALVACGGGGEAARPAAPATTVAAAAPAAGSPAAAPAGAASGKGTASISGKISFEGTPPAAEKVKLGADPKCAALHPNGLEKQAVNVKDGGLVDVIVYVKSGISGSYPAPTEPVVLDQNGCNYVPHVLVMQVNQPLKIRNSDDTLHNIHPRPAVNAEFNVGQPRKGMETTKTFDKPEIMFPVGCDVHPWMRAFVAVLPHPFHSVTGAGGTFTIKDLPAGTYEIEAVHEKLKTLTGTVTVKDGEAGKLDLTFKG